MSTRDQHRDPPSVLLVDDDFTLRELFGEALRQEGLRVATADNGLSALAHLYSHPLPEVIVLDLVMPAMTGCEFRRAQLADVHLADIPVVIVSATLDECDQSTCRASEWISKPIDLGRLLAAISRARASAPRDRGVHDAEAAYDR